jgi:hypothetical protein
MLRRMSPLLALSWRNLPMRPNGSFSQKKPTLAILAAPWHAAAVDARESGLWQPPTASRSGPPSAAS